MTMSKIISELRKNSREKLIFKLNDFQGRHYLDMRLYLVGENGGSDIPSRKGLTLAVDLFPRFKESLVQVEEALITQGLMDKEDLEIQG